MQQIEVDIAGPRAFKTHADLILGFLLVLGGEIGAVEFVGQIITLAGIAVAECSLRSSLRTLVDVGGVEVLAAGGNEGIYHPLGVL